MSLFPGAEPDPGDEGREEPHPAGADAPGGGGAPLRRTGSCGHAQQCLYTNLPLQAAVFLLVVAGHKRSGGWGGSGDERNIEDVTVAIEEKGRRRNAFGFFALEWNGSSILWSSWDLSTLVNTAGPAFAQMSALGLLLRRFFFFFTPPSVLTGLMAKEQALANHIEMSTVKICLRINLQNMI